MDGIVVALQGRLGGDPETRYLPNGSEVLQFSIAPNDSRAPEGQTEWVRVSIFTEKLADGVADKLQRGVEAYVEGRLQLNRWEAQDGAQRAGLRVNAWTVQSMGAIGRRGAPRARQDAYGDTPRMMPQSMALGGGGAAA